MYGSFVPCDSVSQLKKRAPTFDLKRWKDPKKKRMTENENERGKDPSFGSWEKENTLERAGIRLCRSVVVSEGIVGSAETKSPFNTEKRRKDDVEREEKLETEKILDKDAEDSNGPTNDLIKVGVLEVLDVDDVALVEEGNKSTAEDETASNSAVEKRVVELDGPGDENTNGTADVLLKKINPGEVLLGEGHLEQRVKDDINGLLHEVTKRSTESNSLGKLVLDDHDCSDETTVETAESLVELVGIDSAHDKTALAKEELTVGQFVDVADTIPSASTELSFSFSAWSFTKDS